MRPKKKKVNVLQLPAGNASNEPLHAWVSYRVYSHPDWPNPYEERPVPGKEVELRMV